MTPLPERTPRLRSAADEAGSHPAAGSQSRFAVVDIGSNSIRLVVYERLVRAPVAIFNEKILCGLGRTVGISGRLNPDGVRMALDNLERFTRLVQGMGVGRCDVLATAAVRDAADGPDFVAEANRRMAMPIQVVSGEEEARLSALGVISGAPEADGAMGDLGGGSLELVALEAGRLEGQVTMPLGPLRLMAEPGRAAAKRTVERHLGTVDWLPDLRGRCFYPVGGSWRTLAKLHMEQVGYGLHMVDHYTVEGDRLQAFAAQLARQGRAVLEKMPAARRRADTLPYAALVLERLLAMTQPSLVRFSAFGLREGHLFDLLPPEVQAEDPLLAAARDIGERLGRFGADGELARWTEPLFGGESPAERRLRLATCLLSDLGWAEHPDYRAELAFRRVLHMPFAGVDHADRAFLALAVHTRYVGKSDEPVTAIARQLLTPAQIQSATVLGQALRLAHRLCGGVVGLLRRTGLSQGDGKLALTLPADAGVLVGDAVQRRLDALAKTLGLNSDVVIRDLPLRAQD